LKSVIIVGQGIAGTVLAETLLLQGYKVYIYDQAPITSSSLVAAGVYNPIIAKRITTSWMAAQLLPACQLFYTQLQAKYRTPLIHPLDLYMLFDSIEHQNNWATKATDAKYMPWIQQRPPASPHIIQPYGGQWFTGSGYVHTHTLLHQCRTQQHPQLVYIPELFNYAHVEHTPQGVTYQNITADYLFFCEGVQAQNNPWFDYIPFKPAKGEVLTIKVENFKADYIIQSGVYILPQGNDTYIVGATYNWDQIDNQTTAEGKEELMLKVQKVINLPFEVVAHKAGIRPAITDRRPVIGFHPQHPKLGVFNGLGAKGILLAPYFAQHLAQVLAGHMPLSKEIDVNRFLRK
jgi:glycine/D-amino acid oxidase-like deaminating enzyme